MNKRLPPFAVFFCVLLQSFLMPFSAEAGSASANARTQHIVKYWSHERRANAIPRDLVIDPRGLGYLRKRGGELIPYGHEIRAQSGVQSMRPDAKPTGPSGGGGSDTTPPVISGMQPAAGEVIGSSRLFSATITDDLSGVKSVSFVITYPDGVTKQSFSPSYVGNDQWEITLQGFSNGNWSWRVVATDGARRGGNTTSSNNVNFVVDTGAGGSGGNTSYIITDAAWNAGGAIQTAAGRLYFEMPANPNRMGPWTAYVCSGTVATDNTSGRSVILTAAHCVYDDANKAFSRNGLFIPDQAETTASGTDTDCTNDPLGCWAPDFGVVDSQWTAHTFPDNIEWDYAYYVVNDTGAHAGNGSNENLDQAAGSLELSFAEPYFDDGDPSAGSVDFTYALGYSYDQDPDFMYCAEDMTTEGSVNWWLPSCGLSGGSSGGPWVQPMDTGIGSGPIISVNSWGYTTSPGMAGPKFSGTSAGCLFS
ncbi:MAG: hypothetical protein ACU843_12970, partial [Gammaproteobacteria bacterium]